MLIAMLIFLVLFVGGSIVFIKASPSKAHVAGIVAAAAAMCLGGAVICGIFLLVDVAQNKRQSMVTAIAFEQSEAIHTEGVPLSQSELIASGSKLSEDLLSGDLGVEHEKVSGGFLVELDVGRNARAAITFNEDGEVERMVCVSFECPIPDELNATTR